MTKISSPFYEVQLIAIFIIIFLLIIAALFIANSLLIPCFTHDKKNSVIVDDENYFREIHLLIKRQETITQQQSKNRESSALPFYSSMQYISPKSDFNNDNNNDDIENVYTASQAPTDSYQKRQSAYDKEKLADLLDNLKSFKVDHSIQLQKRSKRNKEQQRQINENSSANEIPSSALNNPIKRRLTWTEFQLAQIDNLQEARGHRINKSAQNLRIINSVRKIAPPNDNVETIV